MASDIKPVSKLRHITSDFLAAAGAYTTILNVFPEHSNFVLAGALCLGGLAMAWLGISLHDHERPRQGAYAAIAGAASATFLAMYLDHQALDQGNVFDRPADKPVASETVTSPRP